MATLEERISQFATRVGQECKTIHTNIGALTELPVAQQASVVAAIKNVNESVCALQTLTGTHGTTIGEIQTAMGKLQTDLEDLQTAVGNSTEIDDETASLTTTYSSSKIVAEITAAKQAVKADLLDGVDGAYDTLKEVAAAIKGNQDALTALQTVAAGHVKFDAAQNLTDEQKVQARSNIDAVSSTQLAAVQATAEKGVADAATAQAAAEAAQTTANEGKAKAEANAGLIGTMADLQTTDKATLVAAINAALVVANKGVADAATAASAAATADSKAAAAQNDIDALELALGTIDTDYKAAFEAALAA